MESVSPEHPLTGLVERWGALAADAPANMVDLAQPVGATDCFRVTGESSGSCRGTNVYPGNMSIAVAAVHMGLVKAGMSANVRARRSRRRRNCRARLVPGMTSHDFGRYGSAYRLAVVQPARANARASTRSVSSCGAAPRTARDPRGGGT